MARGSRLSFVTVSCQIGSFRFQNALARRPQSAPPIWLMRQAGRYHSHYQLLRQKYSFMDLCKRPELAAETALGPLRDFDFDAAILFSDLLFPLEALGMGLEYTDAGPRLGWTLNRATVHRLRSVHEAIPDLLFQGEALRATRELLAEDRSLIGFVGGPWTLFAYAVEGSHRGSLAAAKRELPLFPNFCELIVPLLARNIELQLGSGAEVVMIFDTAAGELSPQLFQDEVVPQLELLSKNFSSQLGYYSKGTQPAHLRHALFTEGGFAGMGVDYRWDLREAFHQFPYGFVQGNFDPALLLSDSKDLKNHLRSYLNTIRAVNRDGWVCGLGHGVLPGTPEENVRLFIETVREVLG